MIDLQPGAAFGEYVLERRLGGGGFGEVWLSRKADGGHFALKVLHGHYQSSEAARVRADVELLAASASAGSAHIVRVIGGGPEPSPHIVMEYIQGSDLGREIASRGALPVAEVLHIAESIADALATLQQAGIIHRDIKPANVMIDEQGVVKLMDFGIAKIVGVDSITTTNQIAMSVAYAAPEAFEGKISYFSDHYAFGALLYHCLTGRTLFNGSYIEVMRHHVLTPPNLDDLPRDAPRSLRTLISRCLSKEPEQRAASAAALRTAILAAQAELDAAQSDTVIQRRLQEPKQLGPWVIEAASVPAWTFVCHHESTSEKALIEVRFSDDLQYGSYLQQAVSKRSSRFILRPGEGWLRAPNSQFQFWLVVGPTNEMPPVSMELKTSASREAFAIARPSNSRRNGLSASLPIADVSGDQARREGKPVSTAHPLTSRSNQKTPKKVAFIFSSVMAIIASVAVAAVVVNTNLSNPLPSVDADNSLDAGISIEDCAPTQPLQVRVTNAGTQLFGSNAIITFQGDDRYLPLRVELDMPPGGSSVYLISSSRPVTAPFPSRPLMISLELDGDRSDANNFVVCDPNL